MSTVTMDDWVKANDDAIQAKELATELRAAFDRLYNLRLVAIVGDYVREEQLLEEARAAVEKAESFARRILASSGALSSGLMTAAVAECAGGRGIDDDTDLLLLLERFSELVAAANPALPVTDETTNDDE
ncbi:hypothetical protein [Leucobacter sp. OH1287]|uniref:hypothetical protein n=1 Tax=Leucobacter sp. OH1287 TaxID=2491049 RepID=UPI000F5F1D2C|nr:hypothetical protein [Leucobacter sp. OH1287]RRD61655.1 hypothetical protein EII30_02170 [Leucobacter sp. OH1287]